MATPQSVSQVSVGQPKIGHRTYLSTQHLWMAEHCSEYASSYEERFASDEPKFHIHLRGHVLATISEAVAFLEALVNELLEDAHGGHPGSIQELDPQLRQGLSEYWRISNGNDSILSKYEMVRNIAGLTPYDRGTNPLQDVHLLVRLRNWQVHYRPTTVWDDQPHSLESQLRGKFGESPLMATAGNPWFPDKALGAPCAVWCVSAARAFAEEFTTALEYEPNYKRVNHPKTEPERE